MKPILNRRRVFATLFLLLAAAMLLAGETVLRQRLSPAGSLVYWGGCLLATIAAVLCALLDVGRSLRESHSEQRALLDETVRDINTERERRQTADGAGRKSR